MKMKKIWAILLAAIMLVSCFPALSEEPDESEGVRTNVQLIRGVDIQEELKEDPEGTAEGYLYTLADDSGTILQSLDFKSITVKTGSIHVIVNEKTYISMEAGTSLSYADNAITLKGGTATVSTGETESDDFINEYQTIVDGSVSSLSDIRKNAGSLPILHASVSAKWTMRSDRAQNSRTEALGLIRNRKGHLPHIVVVTGEPMPARIASLALGTGDIDCVYHFALYELVEAVKEVGAEDSIEMLNILIKGKRLKDISDLPLDLAV